MKNWEKDERRQPKPWEEVSLKDVKQLENYPTRTSQKTLVFMNECRPSGQMWVRAKMGGQNVLAVMKV